MSEALANTADVEDLLSVQLSRTFNAPPEKLFEAWTTPELLKEWWGPPGVIATHAEAEPHPGGAWFLDLIEPDGSEVRMAGIYLELSKHDLIRMEIRHRKFDGAEKTPQGYIPTTLEIRLSPHKGGTKLSLSHTGFPQAAQAAAFSGGWSGSLDRLQKTVEG